jgi:beta-galactosidase
MIRYFRNNPSIIVWEIAHNESSDNASYSKEAQAAAEEEYPGDQMYTTGEPSMSCSGDYGASFGYNVIATSTQHNGRSCIGSTAKPMLFGEYGDWDFGGGRDRCGRNSESGMTVLARNHYWSLNANRALSALQADAVWTAIDYQSGGITRSGAIDWARLPKFSAYFYQSQRDPSVTIAGVNSGPMVYIMNWWTQSSPTRIRVFSNCDQVRLSLNGAVVDTKSPDASDPDSSEYLERRPFTFTTPFSSGTLLAEGLIDETVRAKHSVATPGGASKVAALIDTAYLPPLNADGSDMAFVYGSIVDDNGTLLQTATNNITFTITGPATLVTTETGASVTVKAEAGVATALLRAGTTPGQVIVNAASGNLIKGSDTVVVGTAGTQGIISAPPLILAPHVPFSIHRTGVTLRIKIPSMKANGATFLLMSARGRVAGRWHLNKNVTLIDLASLPHGIYFGEIRSGVDRFVQKALW